MSGFKLQDSGEREVDEKTGAMREPTVGKGCYVDIPVGALFRLAVIMTKGAIKYDARNWEKGLPIYRYLDSMYRHLIKYRTGMDDEDHLGQCLFNIHAAIHTQVMIENGCLSKTLLPFSLLEIDEHMLTEIDLGTDACVTELAPLRYDLISPIFLSEIADEIEKERQDFSHLKFQEVIAIIENSIIETIWAYRQCEETEAKKRLRKAGLCCMIAMERERTLDKRCMPNYCINISGQ